VANPVPHPPLRGTFYLMETGFINRSLRASGEPNWGRFAGANSSGMGIFRVCVLAQQSGNRHTKTRA